MEQSEYPIVVGVGQITDRAVEAREALEPLALMVEAARRAGEDSGRSGLLEKVDSVRVVNVVSWKYGDAPGLLADRLGIGSHESVYTTIGGNSPQMLVNRTADDLAAGRIRLALIAGGDAFYAHRLARKEGIRVSWTPSSGEPATTLGNARTGGQEVEIQHGAIMPTQVYPLFENALRAASGLSIEEQRDELARTCARWSAIATENPHSWFREPRTAAEIGTVTAENRMIGFPYPKFMNSVLDVSQGCALLLTTTAVARELGIPEDRWVSLLGGAEANEHFYVLDRVGYSSSPAIRHAGRAALEQAETSVDDLDFLDLYSCFPCAPRIARDMLGIPRDDPRDLTVTGSLLYFGGAGNNHSLHAVATMVERLREKPGTRGLVSGLGWFMTKHAIGLYAATDRPVPWRRDDVGEAQRNVDAEPHPELVGEPEGKATVETYTVLHDRDGTPNRGIVIGRLDDGRRFIANTPSDRAVLEPMEEEEVVGTSGRVTPDGADQTNLFTPS